MVRVLLDTNVIVAAVRSSRGASYRLMELLAEHSYTIVTSVALHLEYDEQLQRLVDLGIASQSQADDIMDFLSVTATPVPISFLLRPLLPDADDDFVLELAVAAKVDYVVTHNRRDYIGASKFGVKVITPSEMLRLLESKP